MENKVKISTQDLNLYYGENHALKNINLDLYENKITAFIGPSGCGKSTYLKTLNRMNDLVSDVYKRQGLRMGNAGFDQTGNGFYRIAETAFFHSVYISFPVFIKIKNSSA